MINKLGFTVEEEQIPGHFHCSFSRPLPHSTVPLVVELHWNLVKDNTSSFNIYDLWNQAKPVAQSPCIKVLSPNHLFYMICLHGWRHNLDSMKYFIDIIQVIYKYKDQLDYEQILALAECHHTLKRIKRTLSIVYEQFPQLNDIKCLPFQNKKVLWEYRPRKGLKLYADFIDYQFLSYDLVKHSLTEFFHWIWPSSYELTSQINKDSQGISRYLQLYKKRIASMVRAIFSH